MPSSLASLCSPTYNTTRRRWGAPDPQPRAPAEPVRAQHTQLRAPARQGPARTSWRGSEPTRWARGTRTSSALTRRSDWRMTQRCWASWRRNTEELGKLDERLEEARKREGETEISEALKARANYLTRIGDKAGQGTGSPDPRPGQSRNRLKVYTALHLVSIHQFKPAADLFLDALSTFTATELISFNDLVAMAVISGTLTRVISAPEVNQVVPEIPVLAELYKNLNESHYDKFFKALATLEQTILLPSRILNPHARHYLREMRILAYTQLLESYRSLTLTSLSAAFGVGEAFVDR
ncbi:hypothetical protein FA15DRAFT_709800 [Coprinopsis marcescibilis]|uniref:PCI domain-containing protein n=1 Tax=Coprinopsis marcescibilis TaxID=230819 RepID=A0A5C3KFS5_COPMA|nr:hypothetical protein FA15DRAFT_709800 [Coprinopsis marcescibilis]